MREWRRLIGMNVAILAGVLLSLTLDRNCAAEDAAAKPVSDADSFSKDQLEFFEKQVQPILKARCLKCHGGEEKIRGGLRLSSRAALLKGGDQGPAIELKTPAESLLLQAINYESLEMPPSGKLPKAEIDILTKWVTQGAPWSPADQDTAEKPHEGPPKVDDAARNYWAYRPLHDPSVPPVKNGGWARNPIDAFLLAKLEKASINPAPPADPIALIRRAYYDLTGLPPKPEEVDLFAADPSDAAYERMVNRLLDSPQYGEKWGRHWLDLVRFAETHGFERDSVKPFAWRYRDYVVNAFNSDKPYDQFLKEQIAGDELDVVTQESMIATGYYRLGQWDDEPADRLLAKYEVLDGIVSTTGQLVLGMTVGCARCHDHKKDPVPQRDYYRMLAFFRDVTDMNPKNTRVFASDEIMCVAEQGREQTQVLIRGNPGAPGDAVEPGFPLVLTSAAPEIRERPAADGTSGKRRALAEWLTSSENPLTSRVMVNRIWQFHFGRGIVPTPNDFGKLGEPPTHPELLEWLAGQFVRRGWRIKDMHRLLMLSSAYRMSSQASAVGLERDPGNMLFWRFNMRRLAAEEVRDSILAVSGTLNLKAGGPGVFPPIPKAVLAGQSVPGSGWGNSPPEEASRRSIYVHVKRSLLVPILAQHDMADTDSSCAARFTTTVPTQALGMLNGEFTNEQAGKVAERLEREAPGYLAGQVTRGIRLTTSRRPTHDEVQHDVEFIKMLQDGSGLRPPTALVQYCLLLLNANEFVYLD